MVEIKILPPGKAYGYDRDSLTDADKIYWDIQKLDDHEATKAAKTAAAIKGE